MQTEIIGIILLGIVREMPEVKRERGSGGVAHSSSCDRLAVAHLCNGSPNRRPVEQKRQSRAFGAVHTIFPVNSVGRCN